MSGPRPEGGAKNAEGGAKLGSPPPLVAPLHIRPTIDHHPTLQKVNIQPTKISVNLTWQRVYRTYKKFTSDLQLVQTIRLQKEYIRPTKVYINRHKKVYIRPATSVNPTFKMNTSDVQKVYQTYNCWPSDLQNRKIIFQS